MVSDEDKARFLRSVDLYVAPNTGGESFGIILVEAMSAGAPVLASDLDAFAQVLDRGAAGELFPNEDADALADAAVRLLADPARRAELRERGSAHVRRFDWSTVGADILSVYETVTAGAAAVAERRAGDGAAGQAGVRPGLRPDGRIPFGGRAEGRLGRGGVNRQAGRAASLAARDHHPHLDRRRPGRDRALSELDRRPARPAARPDRRRPGRPGRAVAAPGLGGAGTGDVGGPGPGRLDRALRGRARRPAGRGGAARGRRERAEPGAAGRLRAEPSRWRRCGRRPGERSGRDGARPRRCGGSRWPVASTTTPYAPPARCAAHRKVRWFRLAGHAPFPLAFEMDDEPPAALADRSGS